MIISSNCKSFSQSYIQNKNKTIYRKAKMGILTAQRKGKGYALPINS